MRIWQMGTIRWRKAITLTAVLLLVFISSGVTDVWLPASLFFKKWNVVSPDLKLSLPRATSAQGSIRKQFTNPSGIVAVLLLIGGETIQKAIAQMTGSDYHYFTPVVFSLGWVSYSFNSVANALGDGIYLPAPESPAVVITVSSGDRRDNRSWLIGRFMRDLELQIEGSVKNKEELDSGLLVTIYKSHPIGGSRGPPRPKKDKFWLWFLGAFLAQTGLACAPWIDHGNWYIFIISLGGNILAILTASLGTMRREKYQGADPSRETYALTRGNGHKHVFIIMPDTLAKDDIPYRSSLFHLERMASSRHSADATSRWSSIILALFWVILLILVAGLDQDDWYLVGIGFIGMMYNLCVSTLPRTPEAHGIPVHKLEKDGELGRRIVDQHDTPGKRPKVMDTLYELEKKVPGAGQSLLPVFFPSRLHESEREKWRNTEVAEDTILGRTTEVRRNLYTPHNRAESDKETKAFEELQKRRRFHLEQSKYVGTSG